MNTAGPFFQEPNMQKPKMYTTAMVADLCRVEAWRLTYARRNRLFPSSVDKWGHMFVWTRSDAESARRYFEAKRKEKHP